MVSMYLGSNIIDSSNSLVQQGCGLFANSYLYHFKNIPVEDKEGIHNAAVRKLFKKNGHML